MSWRKTSINFNSLHASSWSVDLDNSNIVLSWGPSYLSMAYLGSKRWGAYLLIDQRIGLERPDFERDYEFMCEER
jgi:hypothetical protein